MKFKIIADSSCDLDPMDFVSDKFDFVTIPISILIKDTSYIDDRDLNIKNMLTVMKSSQVAFKTAAPASEFFAEEMRAAENIICITLSSKLSGTYNSARIAAETVLTESPKKNIFVLDSLSASAGTAIMILNLIDLLEREPVSDFEEATRQLKAWRDSTKIRFILQDMSNLAKMGRMNKVTAWITSTLPIKLICGDNGNGEIKMYSKTFGLKRGLAALAKTPADKVRLEGADIPIVITHCQNAAAAEDLKSILISNLGLTNIKIFPMRGIASIYANDRGLSIAF